MRQNSLPQKTPHLKHALLPLLQPSAFAHYFLLSSWTRWMFLKLFKGFNLNEVSSLKDEFLFTLQDFEALVLDESVLSLARAERRDALVLEEGDINKVQRYAAYRQFILWKYGYLGEGVRIAIYSCCVCAIRNTFPDPTGQYTGFHAGRLC